VANDLDGTGNEMNDVNVLLQDIYKAISTPSAPIMLFEGAPAPHDGAIAPDLSSLGLGLVLKDRDAEHFRVR